MNQTFEVFTILFCSGFNFPFVASVAIFLSITELFMNPELLDLLTNFFSFLFAWSILFVNLLYLDVVKYLHSMSDIFPSKSTFLNRLATSVIAFLTALKSVAVTKPVILGIYLQSP